jgi:tRNA(fMet)-specific endonuclease VapC
VTSGDQQWFVDTGVLVHVLRGSALGRYVLDDLQLRAVAEVPYVSVVTVGELLSLASQFGWGAKRRAQMYEVLAELIVVDINQEATLERYAELDAWCVKRGWSLGKNDLWIAASAAVTGAMILTVDKDFDALEGVGGVRRLYLDPG